MIRGEFIGKRIKVTDAKNHLNIGIEGRIIDETKDTFTVDGRKRLTLIKKNITIEVEGKTIKGEQLAKKPEERIKG